MQKKYFLKSLLLLFSGFFILPYPTHAQAMIGDLEGVFNQFIGSAIGLVGIICVVMLVVGGIKFLTAGADKEGAAGAQRTITYGIIGLIVTISAWIILSLLGTFLGIRFSTFSICIPGFAGPGCS